MIRPDKDVTNIRLQEIHETCIDVENREVFLHGYISTEDEDPGTDYRMATKVIKNIRFLSNISDGDILINQYNIGGSVDSGMAIYDAIKLCKCHISLVCHGISASMGSIILQAADTRLSMPNCIFLIHEGTTGINNGFTIKQSKSLYKLEEYMSKLMFDIYADRMSTGKFFKNYSRGRIKSFLKRQLDKYEDWMITSEEALEYGLIDNIVN